MARQAVTLLMLIFTAPTICASTSSTDVRGTARYSLPELSPAFCVQFFRNLELHTMLSKTDRQDSERLGIASVAFAWIPLLPSIPLGVSAIVLGARCDTLVRRNMVSGGVTDLNWRDVNFRCGEILERESVRNATFEGRRRDAINYGIAGIVLSTLSAIAFALLYYFFEIRCCWGCCGTEDSAECEQHSYC